MMMMMITRLVMVSGRWLLKTDSRKASVVNSIGVAYLASSHTPEQALEKACTYDVTVLLLGWRVSRKIDSPLHSLYIYGRLVNTRTVTSETLTVAGNVPDFLPLWLTRVSQTLFLPK